MLLIRRQLFELPLLIVSSLNSLTTTRSRGPLKKR
jgi:hypothetical protein